MAKIKSQVQDYLEYCEKIRGMTDATMVAKRNILHRFIKVAGINDLKEFSNEVFNNWVKHEAALGVSARSINTYNSVIVAIVKYYREMGMEIPLNITLIGRLKEGKVRRGFYTSEEIKKVVSVADVRTGLIIQMMFETGMRIAEITRLRRGNFYGRRISFIGKGRKPREVYITERTFDLLQKYVSLFEVKDYLWGVYEFGGDGEPPTVNTVRNWLRQAFEMAGFVGFYPHALRHSFATDLQRRGASVEEIKEMIGHENIATTERYLHGLDGRLMELFDKYR